jgi:hypothetical protein
MALLLVVQWLERDLAGKPGPTFPDRAQKPGILFLFEHDLVGKPVSIFPDHARGALGPKKEARPKGPGAPYALRRNIVRKRQKTMVCLAFG